MFSIALWDGPAQRLFLARDRLGVKPLYYADRQGVFLFGSEPKALLQHPLVTRELDFDAISQYLTFNAVAAPRTLFRDIRKLQPGTVLWVSPAGIQERRFWDVSGEELGSEEGEESYVRGIRDLFRAATKKRMMSDVPFGAFLSGGLDSSLTVAFMTEILERPVSTFTIGFTPDDPGADNELEYARLVSSAFGSHHRELLVTPRDILESLPTIIHHLDDPVGDPAPVSNFHVARLVRQSGVTVAQVGEGSDELFLGYPSARDSMRSHQFWSRYAAWPAVARKALCAVARPGLLALGNPAINGLADAQVVELLRRAANRQHYYWGFGNCFSEIDKQFLLTDAFRLMPDGEQPHDVVAGHLRAYQARNPRASFIQQATYLDLKVNLAERQLMRVDKMTMAWSVEARVPFLDHLLVEFAMRIPDKMKLGTTPKHILKKSAEGLIPPEIIHRPKMGFPTPRVVYLSPEVRAFVLARLSDSAIHRLGILSQDYIKRLVQGYDRGRTNTFYRIWNLFTLAYWYDHWVEGRCG
jgi:asparagine synthase (glutamine-hydrolysing)